MYLKHLLSVTKRYNLPGLCNVYGKINLNALLKKVTSHKIKDKVGIGNKNFLHNRKYTVVNQNG